MCKSIQKNSKTLRSAWELLAIDFLHIYITVNVIKLTPLFAMIKNMQTTEKGMNGIHNVSTMPHKKILKYE